MWACDADVRAPLPRPPPRRVERQTAAASRSHGKWVFKLAVERDGRGADRSERRPRVHTGASILGAVRRRHERGPRLEDPVEHELHAVRPQASSGRCVALRLEAVDLLEPGVSPPPESRDDARGQPAGRGGVTVCPTRHARRRVLPSVTPAHEFLLTARSASTDRVRACALALTSRSHSLLRCLSVRPPRPHVRPRLSDRASSDRSRRRHAIELAQRRAVVALHMTGRSGTMARASIVRLASGKAATPPLR